MNNNPPNPTPSVTEERLLIEESLYHLRLDERAKAYHERALAYLNRTDQPPQQTGLTDVERVHDDGTLKLLLRLADNDIEREGETASTMVRVGLLRDIINELLNYRAALLVSNRSGVESEIERLQDLLDTERYKVAIGVQAVLKAIQSRQWLSEPGRGSYAYDDERYQQEFGQALNEIEAALSPLRAIARDWSDCPTDPLRVAANRSAARTALDTEKEK